MSLFPSDVPPEPRPEPHGGLTVWRDHHYAGEHWVAKYGPLGCEFGYGCPLEAARMAIEGELKRINAEEITTDPPRTGCEELHPCLSAADEVLSLEK